MTIDESNNWIIMTTDNVVLYQDTQERIQMTWDCNTRTLENMQCQYKDVHTSKDMAKIYEEEQIDYKGELLLMEIHNSLDND